MTDCCPGWIGGCTSWWWA